jgi:Ca-activated chloride channel family protein
MAGAVRWLFVGWHDFIDRRAIISPYAFSNDSLNMNFVTPQSLLLLILLPVAIGFLVWRARVYRARLIRLGDEQLISRLMPEISTVRRVAKSVLWLATFASLVVALARPVWGEDVSIIETQGLSVIVALDVSRSMDAQDVAPSRLERAKFAINDLFESLSGNQLGLILFAGTAFVQIPLTTDTMSASTFLKAASSDSITRQGTNIDAALQLAIESFHEEMSAQRIIILVTDGENHEGDPLKVADWAAELGIVIYTMGYGNIEGAAIPLHDSNGNATGYQTDRAGNLVLSILDEPTLRAIAERTGGTYQSATPSGQEITNLTELLRNTGAGDLGTRVESRSVERFGIFVALALVALSFEMILSEMRKAVA